MNKDDKNSNVYLLTNRNATAGRDLLTCVEEALRAGIAFVQYREKDRSFEGYEKMARDIQALCSTYGVPFIVNDDLDLACQLDADGVHLGQDDLKRFSFEEARRRMGDGKLIGVSAVSVEEAYNGQKLGADYIGFGPIFKTKTKKDIREPHGLDILNELKFLKVPLVAIGGIRLNNAPEVLKMGASYLAIISGVLAQENIYDTVKKFNSIQQ